MKKLLLLLIAAYSSAPVVAQESNHHYRADSLLSRWVIGVDVLGGLVSQNFTTPNTFANYPNTLNTNTGMLKYRDGYSFGGEAQLGFFFGKKRHFGIGAGFLYMQQHGDAVLNNYHVEYKATDGSGNIYRQLVTGNDVRESIISTNINIPFVLKYKNRFSKHWGFAADAGALFNLQMNNAYTTHAAFDYEAIYKFVPSGDGGTVSVYDNATIPSSNDWFITKAEFLKNNPNGNYQDYINAKRALGFNVGQGMNPGTRKGNSPYSQGSVGLIIQPSFNYFLSDHTALNFGAYYMLQPFKSNPEAGYRLTDGMGTYSSVMNNVKSSINQSYGINIGVRFFLGNKREPLVITSIDQSSPTYCGLCDGNMVLHGLIPNQPVTVDYSVNGGQPASYPATAQSNGDVKITNLCAGNYTGITAKIKKRTAAGKDVAMADPAMRISSQNPSNPTMPATCDGSVTLNGLYAGKTVKISYNLNGAAQPGFTGVVNSGNSITISGLCEGTYTGIVATTGNCTANGADFTLVAPLPPTPPAPPAPPAATVTDKIDISTPILFDFNKTTVHKDSYPVLKEAAEEMKEDRNKTITINGYTDIIGTPKYNQALSVKRANAVKKHLTKMGVNPHRLKVVGHGANQPVESNNTAEGRHEDRRAVMKAKN